MFLRRRGMTIMSVPGERATWLGRVVVRADATVPARAFVCVGAISTRSSNRRQNSALRTVASGGRSRTRRTPAPPAPTAAPQPPPAVNEAPPPAPSTPPTIETPTPNSPEEARDIARAWLEAKYPGRAIEMGEPGAMEGAAGSIYIEIPATAAGSPPLAGTVVLRRVNNVDGSTAEQRRWHVANDTLK